MIRFTTFASVLAVVVALLVTAAVPDGGVPSARAQTIYVPKPKGEGETLDASATTASDTSLDIVATVGGDRLTGTVAEMEADGVLRLSGPQYDGDVLVRVSALDHVAFAGKDEEPGADEVVLTNADRLLGQLVAITPDAVVLETGAAGPLRISRKVIRSVHIQKGRSVLLESRFASGRMEPWVARGGTWSINDGCLISQIRGSGEFIYAKLDQKEAVTFVAKVEALSGNYVQCSLVLCADTADNMYGRNSVIAMYSGNEYYLHHAQNGSVNSIVNRNFGTTLRSGVLRVAYDPETGKARLWLDSTDLGEYAVPSKPKNGQYVIFAPQQPIRVRDLQVLRGIVPPSGADVVSEAAQGDVIRFVNKDRVSVTSVALADGQLTAQASYGELRIPAENVESILFAEKGLEEPRRRKGDVLVQSSAGRFTLQFEKLTREHLIGRSDCLGEVKVGRSAIRKIEFNIYR